MFFCDNHQPAIFVNIYIHKAACGSVRPSETNASSLGQAFRGLKDPEMLVHNKLEMQFSDNLWIYEFLYLTPLERNSYLM